MRPRRPSSINCLSATGNTKITGTGATTGLAFAMNDQRLAYSGTATGVSTTMTSPELPFPSVTLSYAEAGFDFLMPVSPSDTPADFTLLTKIIDLTVSDEIWGIIDPTAQLPRDPATIVGPVVSQAQRERIEAGVARAVIPATCAPTPAWT